MFINQIVSILFFITITHYIFVCDTFKFDDNKSGAHGCEFIGNNLTNVKSEGMICGYRCVQNINCTHFTWTDHNNGTCWMKRNGATKADAVNSSSKSACGIVTGVWNGNWARRCDFLGKNLSSVQLFESDFTDFCTEKCLNTIGCTHFVWSDHNNGTCWLKQYGATKQDALNSSNPLAVCGIVEGGRYIKWKGKNWASNCDFNGNNLTSFPSTRENCRGLCAHMSHCTHYTWTNYDGGTCWMKKNGATKVDAFYILDPLAECGIINIDYVVWNENGSADGCAFIGNDLERRTIGKKDCRNLCVNTKDCTHYTWNNHSDGTCWMKKNGARTSNAMRVSDSTSMCGIITEKNSGFNFMWNVNNTADRCIFKDNDFHNARSPKDGCRDLCIATPECTHFMWNNKDNGTCWLKNNLMVTKFDALPSLPENAICGIVTDLRMANGENITWDENNSAVGCDFHGNDLTNVPSTEELCRNLCILTTGCTHFSWTATAGREGVCSMKSNGATKADAVFSLRRSTVCGIISSDMSRSEDVNQCDYCKRTCSTNVTASSKQLNGTHDIVYFIKHLNESVKNLDLAASGLKELEVQLFIDLRHLEELKLSQNELETIMPGTFKNQQKLQSLLVDRNRIGNLSGDAFRGLTSLRLLDLSCNHLRTAEIEASLFDAMSELVELNLSHNNLSSISGTAFRGLHNLKIIRINDNRLKTIHSNAFSHTLNLEKLYLDTNQLAFETHNNVKIFQFLPKLKQLHLAHNRITKILPDWRKIPDLRVLSLGSNKITTLNYEDLNFTSSAPVVLNLENNHIYVSIDATTIDDINYVIVALNRLDCCNFNVSNFMASALNKSSRIRFAFSNLNCSSVDSSSTSRRINEFNFRTMTCPVKECPSNCRCWKKPFDNALIFNCSYANLKHLPAIAYNGRYSQVELHVDHNNLSHNLLKDIHPNNLPRNLRVLDLSHNQIQRLDEHVFEELNKVDSLEHIALGNNPWLCDCSKEAKKLVAFVTENELAINDLKEMRCSDQQIDIYGLKDQFIENICSQQRNKIAFIVVAVVCLLIGFFSILYVKYQQTIKIWLYAHNMCLCWVDEDDLDKDKKYDAFVSYSHHDVDFAIDTIVAQLENGTPRFKICIHDRDWIAGEFILESISASIACSRRTIIILSQSFLTSMWGRTEFQYAHNAAVGEKRTRVIIIIYGDIGNINDLEPDLQSYLRSNTYVKWGEKWFWEKLRYALGHKP